MTQLTDTRGESEPLPNPKRGCGTLERGKAYFVGAGFADDGVLPSWVELDPPVPFREIGTSGEFTRGFRRIDGLTLQLALEESTEFVEHYPDELHGDDREDLLREARENHVECGVYNNLNRVPKDQAGRHIGRIRHRGTEGGQHWGEIPHAGATDYLMRAGVSYYETSEAYAREAIEYGLSKAVPASKGNIPPVVSGITRCWIMHPNACAGYGGGVIGFAYLSEVAFTEPAEGELPTYIEEAAEAGRLAVRDFEAPPATAAEGDEDQLSVDDYLDDAIEEADLDADEIVEELDEETDAGEKADG